MFELERKHLKAYLKDRKEIKATDKKIHKNKNNFYKISHYFINEYYKNLKKEFLDSEIINDCEITDIILNEFKEYLRSKNVAKCEDNKITINYETIIFLTSLNHEYKRFHTIDVLIILTFIISSLTLIFQTLNQKILKLVIPIAVIVILGLLYYIHVITRKQK